MKKVRYFTLGMTFISIVAPVALAVSCEKNNKPVNGNYYLYNKKTKSGIIEKIDIWTGVNELGRFQATVDHWIDGDTLWVEKEDGIKARIRVKNVDTREIDHSIQGDSPPSAAEEDWGQKATQLGEKLLPKGTKIRIVANGDKSYDRLVGSIYYGPKFLKNYEFELLVRGLAYPTMKVENFKRDFYAEFYSGMSLLNAYTYAKKNKIGLFGLISEQATKHGPTVFNSDEFYAAWKGTHD